MIKIGNKIVCVRPVTRRIGIDPLDYKGPVVGEIYTVRDILENNGRVGIRLEEIINRPHLYDVGMAECAFIIEAFREVDYSFGEEVCSNVEQEVLELQEI